MPLFLPLACLPAVKPGDKPPPPHLRSIDESPRRFPVGSTGSHKLAASIHEAVGFLFVIKPDKAIARPKLGLRWPADAASGAIRTELARVHQVHIDQFPGWHVRSVPPAERRYDPLDVLIPLDAPRGGMPTRMDPGADYVFWIEFAPELGTPPGSYNSSIVLESSGKPLGTLNVELTVWPMTLPETGELMAIGEVDHVGLFRHHLSGPSAKFSSAMTWYDQPDGDLYGTLLDGTLRLLQEHRIAGLLPDLRPGVKVSTRGELEVDWRHYDRVAEPLLTGEAFANRLALPVWLIPLHAVMSSAEGDTLSAPGSQQLARQYVSEVARHFEDRGWLSRSIALVNHSAMPAHESLLGESRLAELVRSARNDIRIASRRFPQNMELYGWANFPTISTEPSDVWITDGQFFDVRAMTSQRASGREGWIAADRPPFTGSTSIHARPGDTLALSWQAAHLGAEYLWLGPVNKWPIDGLPVDPTTVARTHPQALLFPGKAFGLARPVPTLRLKRVRESMQHAAYARLLAQHGRNHVVEEVRDSLVEYAGTGAYRTHFLDGRPVGWPANDAPYENARRILAQEFEGLTPSSANSNAGSDLPWPSFVSNLRRVQLLTDGTRIRLTGTPVQPRVQIESWYTVVNATRQPLRGTISLLAVPESCETVESGNSINLSMGRSQRGSLSLTCDAAWLASGKKDLLIQFSQDNELAIQKPVRLSAMIAQPTARPLTIDGDLSDWVAAAGNVASDFRLIAGDCEYTEKNDCDRPSLQTFAFTRRDADFLYVGINAEALPDAGSTVRRSTVTYDDLIPMDDEDLVEILIDPLNGGTRSPADLYHIVVKRSGVYLTERGIMTDPPLGPPAVWQTDIIVASRSQPDRWTAELRIPLASFHRPGGVRGELWGFNVTHYQASRQEFSTWSGAVGNAYDPLSLGNLLLP